MASVVHSRTRGTHQHKSSLDMPGTVFVETARNSLSTSASSFRPFSPCSSMPPINGPRMNLRSFSMTQGRRRQRPLWEIEKKTYWESRMQKQRVASRSSFQLAAASSELRPFQQFGAANSETLDRVLSLPILSKAKVFRSETGNWAMEDSEVTSERGHESSHGNSIRPQDAGKAMPNVVDDESWTSAALATLPSPRRSKNPRLAPQTTTSPRKKTLVTFDTPSEAEHASASENKSPQRKVPRSATSMGVKGGRSMTEVLVRDHARVDIAQGFTARELARMRVAFRRFRETGNSEVNREELHNILMHLGYFGASRHIVEQIAVDVSDFSTFSFYDFVEVAELFVAYERDQLVDLFEKYAIDGELSLDTEAETSPASASQTVLFPASPKKINPWLEAPSKKPMGGLSVDVLPELMRELEVFPARDTIREVLLQTSEDPKGRGFLTYDGFIRFMAAYRVTEGFRREDIFRAQKIFRIYAIPTVDDPNMLEMDPLQLGSALISLFGAYSTQKVKSLVDKLSLTATFSTPADVEDNGAEDESSPQNQLVTYGVSFHEFLIWGRRTLDAIKAELHRDFQNYADSSTSTIRAKQLPDIMQGLGITLSYASLLEFLEDVGMKVTDTLDFDTFYRFAQCVQKSSGFRKYEVEQLTDVFDKYDYNSNGEIENLELLDLLRYLGYDTSLEDVHRFLKEVDANSDGAMDLNEFLRKMRVKYETDVSSARHAFQCFCDSSSNTIALKNVMLALESIGQNVRADVLKRAMGAHGSVQVFDFDRFLQVVNFCRQEMAAEKRKRAAFSDADFHKLERIFADKCKDGAQFLKKGDWLWLLKEIGVPIDTKDERDKILQLLDGARSRAVEAGLTEEELAAEGKESMSFWHLVHLLRMIVRDSESKLVSREEEAMDAARFTRAEVNEFRDVFLAWVERSGSCSSPSSPTRVRELRGRRKSLPDISTPTNRAQTAASLDTSRDLPMQQRSSLGSMRELRWNALTLEAMMDRENENLLPICSLNLLLCSISVNMTLEENRHLKQKAFEIGHRHDSLDFSEFLLVMRFILDENLGGIRGKFSFGGSRRPTTTSHEFGSSRGDKLLIRRSSL